MRSVEVDKDPECHTAMGKSVPFAAAPVSITIFSLTFQILSGKESGKISFQFLILQSSDTTFAKGVLPKKQGNPPPSIQSNYLQA
jgi:hypothetical protein